MGKSVPKPPFKGEKLNDRFFASDEFDKAYAQWLLKDIKRLENRIYSRNTMYIIALISFCLFVGIMVSVVSKVLK